MPLVEFTQIRRRADNEPRLGVQSKGRLSMNALALRAIGDPTHVVLLFDPEDMQLGVRAAGPDEAHAYQLTGTGTGKENEAKTVSLVALFNHFKVDSEAVLGSYRPEVVDGRMLVIQLTTSQDGLPEAEEDQASP